MELSTSMVGFGGYLKIGWKHASLKTHPGHLLSWCFKAAWRLPAISNIRGASFLSLDIRTRWKLGKKMELNCFYLTKTRICWQVQAKTRHGWKSVAIEQNGCVTKKWRNNGWKNTKKISMSLVGKSSKFCDSRSSQWVVIIRVHGFYRSRFRTHVNHILWLIIYLKNQGPQNDICVGSSLGHRSTTI